MEKQAITSVYLRCFLPVVLSVVGLLGCAAREHEERPQAPVESTAKSADALAANITVFDDAALTQPWENWGWSSTVETNDRIKTTLSDAWGALSLARSTGDLPTASYETITFDIRSNATAKIYFS